MSNDIIVIGLGFGDEGKGATVDKLCAERPGATVVRFSGGAQTAHNVVVGKMHHTFKQFGSGTLAGAKTYLSEHVLVNPIMLDIEAVKLYDLGVDDPMNLLTIHPRALVTTPYHVMANKHKESQRNSPHGSCGLGIGETVEYELKTGKGLRVWECQYPQILKKKLAEIIRYYQNYLQDRDIYSQNELIQYYSDFGKFVNIDGYNAIAANSNLIFEGTQGVLLDEWRGFHPHTTWATTTQQNAQEILAKIGRKPGYVLGVTRTYHTRHGFGPFPSESEFADVSESYNHFGKFQGGWRQGYFDQVLFNYAIEACGGVDGLSVTHLDHAQNWPGVIAYDYKGHQITRLPLGEFKDLRYQERMTNILNNVKPIFGPSRVYDIPFMMMADGPDRKDRNIYATQKEKSLTSQTT